MKFYILIFTLVYSVWNIKAQGDMFLEGSWATSTKDIVNSNNQYFNIQTITISPFEEDQLMIFTSTTEENDNIVKAFQILQDNLTWGPVLWEGGEAIIEASNLEVRQLDDNQNSPFIYKGNWGIISSATHPKGFFKSKWIAHNNGSPIKLRTMVAFFKKEREFVLSVDNSTIGCTEGYVEIYINGTVIREDRPGTVTPKRFYPGSSFYAKGHRISIKSFAQCDSGKGISGTFKFRI